MQEREFLWCQTWQIQLATTLNLAAAAGRLPRSFHRHPIPTCLRSVDLAVTNLVGHVQQWVSEWVSGQNTVVNNGQTGDQHFLPNNSNLKPHKIKSHTRNVKWHETAHTWKLLLIRNCTNVGFSYSTSSIHQIITAINYHILYTALTL